MGILDKPPVKAIVRGPLGLSGGGFGGGERGGGSSSLGGGIPMKGPWCGLLSPPRPVGGEGEERGV